MRTLLAAGLTLSLIAPALAEPVGDARRQSFDAFAAAHADCREWSDGCAVCRRTQDKDFACSLPGIACQPTGLACRDSAPRR